MKEKIKELVKLAEKYKWFLLVILIIGGAFYWYEWRPVKIKHDCSWVERHADAVPTNPARCEKSNYIPFNPFIKFTQTTSTQCELGFVFIPAEPAQPAKDWRDPATKDQYNFCIHEKGL